jgi:hypothetical protein
MHASGDTAIGFTALQNDEVGSNTAAGINALSANTTGFNSAAFGVSPLESNIDGTNNTAIGNFALDSNTSGDDNVALGRHAGDGITIANNNIIIGHLSGVHSVFSEVDNSCYSATSPVRRLTMALPLLLFVDADGKLGTMLVDRNGSKVTAPGLPDANPPLAVPARQSPTTKDAQ